MLTRHINPILEAQIYAIIQYSTNVKKYNTEGSESFDSPEKQGGASARSGGENAAFAGGVIVKCRFEVYNSCAGRAARRH
jgi:hypothetical protein